MYCIKNIEERIRIPPTMFGSDIENAVLRILREKFERRIYRDIGIILSVDNPSVLSKGVIIPGDSGAYYTVGFDALTFLPAVNEVFNAEIKEVVEFGAFVSIGPLQGLLHVSQIGKDKFYYDKKNKTLVSKIAKKSLKKGDGVVVKVSTVSLKANTADTKVGLTMRPDGLGKPEWLEKVQQQSKGKTKKAEGESS
jgi:DNA-directed RNA polymerase subunit E'